MTPEQLSQLQDLLELAVHHSTDVSDKKTYATALDVALRPEIDKMNCLVNLLEL